MPGQSCILCRTSSRASSSGNDIPLGRSRHTDDRNHCENGGRNPPPIRARRQNAVEPFEAGFLAITRGNIVFDLQNSKFQRIPLRRDVLLGAIGPEPQSRDECARIVKTRQAAASSPWVAFDSIE